MGATVNDRNFLDVPFGSMPSSASASIDMGVRLLRPCRSAGGNNLVLAITLAKPVGRVMGKPAMAEKNPGAQFAFGTGVAAAGWAVACGARPTITVSSPWPHNRCAAFLASSSVTASTMALRFSM